MSPFYKHAPSLQLLQGGVYFHSDDDTPDTVPYVGLAASTRAYATDHPSSQSAGIERFAEAGERQQSALGREEVMPAISRATLRSQP